MNTATRPVVVGIVGAQEAALTVALRYARAAHAPLRVVHSYFRVPEMVLAYTVHDVVHDLHVAGQTLIDEIRAYLDDKAPDVTVTYALTGMAPVEALELEAESALMMVLGVDDVAWFERMFRTKVAGHVALQATCPVVVVPEISVHLGTVNQTVLTLDGESSADGPLRFAFESADVEAGSIHVLHAAPPGTTPADVEAIRANLAEVLAGWREDFPNVSISTTCPEGEARDVLATAAQDAGLIVVGRPHGHTVPWAMSRPLAAELLRVARCPVAVVPATYGGF